MSTKISFTSTGDFEKTKLILAFILNLGMIALLVYYPEVIRWILIVSFSLGALFTSVSCIIIFVMEKRNARG